MHGGTGQNHYASGHTKLGGGTKRANMRIYLRSCQLVTSDDDVIVAAGMRQEVEERENTSTSGLRQTQKTQLESFN